MIYALNLYDIKEGEEDTYRQYVTQATAQLKGLNAKPVCTGNPPVRRLKGDSRQHMLVMKFGNEADFDAFMQRLEEEDLHRLRESSTENYIWTLYKHWDVKQWLEMSHDQE